MSKWGTGATPWAFSRDHPSIPSRDSKAGFHAGSDMSLWIGERPNNRSSYETAAATLQAIIIALLISTFLFQPFRIPSGSMEPTLLVGDYLFASKFSYGYSRYSLPFSPPLFSGRILAFEPKRGDVVIFRHGSD